MAMTSLIRLLTGFSGRIGRSTWWLGLLVILAASTAGSFVIDPGVWTADPPRAPAPALALLDLFLVWPATAISVKRFNDCDRPWWFGYALGLLGIVMVMAEQNGFLLDPEVATAPDYALFSVVALVFLAAMLDNGLSRGTPGPNRYGPDPQGRPIC